MPAPASGVLTRLDARAIGVAAWRLGAGRARKEDAVSAGAGIELHAKPGATVVAGQPLLTMHADDESRFASALAAAEPGIEVSAAGSGVDRLPLIIDRIA